ncbi:GMC oxidoreductase [Salinicoccus sp. ID82-1]|uniref:GMC oxidoreductase n=1 Tax=Salinicoccus sp. ID82-1 TaxID=2820269 RepID=UPI001F340A60|nr:GMC oxidoreductase [Salinicoccus sp. ID82-1]
MDDRVTNSHTQQDINLNRYALQICEEIANNMGADKVSADELSDDIDFNHTFYSTHYGGGAIMGDDPSDSAVNTCSQMWEMENLFIIGSSVFPHFGNYNPTGTVCALAYRATEGMIEYLSGDGGLLEEPAGESEEETEESNA